MTVRPGLHRVNVSWEASPEEARLDNRRTNEEEHRVAVPRGSKAIIRIVEQGAGIARSNRSDVSVISIERHFLSGSAPPFGDLLPVPEPGSDGEGDGSSPGLPTAPPGASF